MSLQEINKKMIEIEEKINLENHRLSLKFGNRQDRENNWNNEIISRIEILDNEWDRLSELIHNL